MKTLLITAIVCISLQRTNPVNSDQLWHTISTVIAANTISESYIQESTAALAGTIKIVGDITSPNVISWDFFGSLTPVLLVSSISLVPPTVSPVNIKEASGDVIVPELQAFRHSPNVEKVLVFIHPNSSKLDLYPDFNSYQLRSLLKFPFNTHPQQTHHIFLGNEADIRAAFVEDSIKLLQHKTGVVVSRVSKSVAILCERPASKELQLVTILDYAESKTKNTDMLLNRHFTIYSYPLKTHIIRDSSGTPIGGIGFNFAKTLAEKYNVTFDYRLDGFRNTNQMPNGSWNGFLGALADSRADMAVWLGYTYGRYPYADFSSVVFNLPVVFFTSLPQVTVKWDGILHVFSTDVWIYIALSVIVPIPIFYAKFTCGKLRHEPSLETPLYFSVILPLAILLEGSVSIPRSTRTLTGVFLFYGIVIGTFFNSNLISFLTYPEADRVPETPTELASMTDYHIKYIHYPGAVDDTFFRQTTDPTFLNIKKRMEYHSYRSMAKAMMETVAGKKVAIIRFLAGGLMDLAGNATLNPEFIPVQISKVQVLESLVRFVLRKYSKFTESISEKTGILQSTGHFDKWFCQVLDAMRKDGIRWLKRVKTIGPEAGLAYRIVALTEDAIRSTTKPFTLKHFAFAFGCLICGMALAVGSFAFESISLLTKQRANEPNANEIAGTYDALQRQFENGSNCFGGKFAKRLCWPRPSGPKDGSTGASQQGAGDGNRSQRFRSS